jgi:outer membrane protein assembly factor BamB
MRSSRTFTRLSTAVAALVFSTALSAGCDSLFGEDEEPPLPGTRISVMALEREIAPDSTARTADIVLPPPIRNTDWPQPGGFPNHAMHHLELAEAPERAWRIDVGSSASSDQPRLPSPIVFDGKVFTMDADHEVRAFSAETGDLLWSQDLSDDEDDDTITGGIAIESGRLFATTGYGAVFALDTETGNTIWRRSVGYPIHAPPAVRAGRVFFLSVTNKLFALDGIDGTDLWEPYQAIEETASLLGGPSPAIDAGVVVAPFTSGEVIAATVGTGRVSWQDSLSSRRRTDELAALSQIRARPVIDRGRVYVISFRGVLTAIDLRTGQRIWERDIAGLQSPWIAGDYLYVVTTEGDVICLSAVDGRIFWVTSLPGFEDEEDLEDPIIWSGPVVGGNRVIVVGSHGEAKTLSPYDGAIIGELELDSDAALPPIIANGTVYLLLQDATLVAYR